MYKNYHYLKNKIFLTVIIFIYNSNKIHVQIKFTGELKLYKGQLKNPNTKKKIIIAIKLGKNYKRTKNKRNK